MVRSRKSSSRSTKTKLKEEGGKGGVDRIICPITGAYRGNGRKDRSLCIAANSSGQCKGNCSLFPGKKIAATG